MNGLWWFGSVDSRSRVLIRDPINRWRDCKLLQFDLERNQNKRRCATFQCADYMLQRFSVCYMCGHECMNMNAYVNMRLHESFWSPNSFFYKTFAAFTKFAFKSVDHQNRTLTIFQWRLPIKTFIKRRLIVLPLQLLIETRCASFLSHLAMNFSNEVSEWYEPQ